MDLDLDLDLDFDFNFKKVKTNNQKFTIAKGVDNLESFCLPEENNSIRLVSPQKGFSSCCLLLKISELCKIKSLKLTTLRVGKKECIALKNLEIPSVEICCGAVQKETLKNYNYSQDLEKTAQDNDWKLFYARNHSKLMLIDTDKGFLTVETSSNFNENPQIEQFCITNNKSVYNFYLKQLRENGIFCKKK